MPPPIDMTSVSVFSYALIVFMKQYLFRPLYGQKKTTVFNFFSHVWSSTWQEDEWVQR